MKKEILKIVWQRYNKLLIASFALWIAIYCFSIIPKINYWHQQQRYMESQEFKEFFDSEMAYAKEVGEPGVYIDYNEMTQEPIYTTSFEIFKEKETNNLKFWSEEEYLGSMGDFYQSGSFIIYLAVFFGLMVFMYDNKSHFNQVWLSSRFAKKDIFIVKITLFTSVFVLANLIGTIICMVLPSLLVPPEAVLMSFTELIPSMLAGVLLGTAYYFSGVFAGVILGEWISGIITLVGFFYTLPSAVYALQALGITLIKKGTQNAIQDGDWPYQAWIYKLGAGEVPLSQWLSLSVLIIIFGLTSFHLFKKVSTENNGKYLMFDQLKRPVLILSMLYVWITIFAVQGVDILLASSGVTLLGKVSQVVISLFGMLVTYVIAKVVIDKRIPFMQKKS